MEDIHELRDAILRTDLSSFIAKTFHTVNPGTLFLPNWHIDLIAETLEECAKGNIKRLVINMPPRAMKSVSVSVAWPAWILGQDPSARVLAASYSQMLSTKHSLDCKRVVESSWYKQLFPEMKLSKSQNDKRRFVTSENGYRFATSTGGSVTGDGGNFLIIDDPQNPTKITSRKYRHKTIEWFEKTFSTRLDNKKEGVIVLVMQRLHEDDLAGHLLKTSNWQELSLKAIASKDTKIHLDNKILERKKGEVLHEAREGIEEINHIKTELGRAGFYSQYQQDPSPADGNLINPTHIKKFKKYGVGFDEILQSWDCAIKANKDNDYTVCTTWGVTKTGYYLIDVLRKKMEYPELLRRFYERAGKYQPNCILVEDHASGQALIQEVRVNTNLPVIDIKPKGSKEARVANIVSYFEAGRVNIESGNEWEEKYIRELSSFPNSSHDDQVDSTSQFLNFMQKRNNREVRIRSLD